MFQSGIKQHKFLLCACILCLFLFYAKKQVENKGGSNVLKFYDSVCGCDRNLDKTIKNGFIPLNRTSCSEFAYNRGSGQKIVAFSYFPTATEDEERTDPYLEVNKL